MLSLRLFNRLYHTHECAISLSSVSSEPSWEPALLPVSSGRVTSPVLLGPERLIS